jgi:hypothetical protein
LTISAVAIAEKIAWRRVLWEGVHDLLSRPAGRGVLGHVEVKDASAVMSEDDQHEENAEARGENGKEIDGDEILDVIGQERAPGLRGWRAALGQQAGDGALGHVEAELEELTVDSWSTPEWIGGGHASNQTPDLGVDARATGGEAGELRPVVTEAATLPPYDGVG